MDDDLIASVGAYIERMMAPEDCDGTLKYVARYLKIHGKSIKAYRDWLHSNGVCCDCEYMFNIIYGRD